MQNTECNNSNVIKYLIYILLAGGLLFTGCQSTSGTLEIEGKVIDEHTREQIPGRNIVIQGLVKKDSVSVLIDAGQFSTDSSGSFSYSFMKVKDARFYDFSLAGDSDYVFTTRTIGLMELERNAKFLIFSLSKLVDLTMVIKRKSKKPVCDTLSLTWESNGIYHRFLYPFKIYNQGKENKTTGLNSDAVLNWIGGDVSSTVSTRVFADKKTKILWDLRRNGKKQEFIDTITCRRDQANIVSFTY